MCKMTDFDFTLYTVQQPASQAENCALNPSDAIL